MPLRPVFIDETFLGQPLPWDLYTASGVLVAGAGLVLDNAEQLNKLAERQVFRQAEGVVEGHHIVPRIDALIRHFPVALKIAGTPRLEPLARLMAREIMSLADADHDASLGLLRLQPMADPAARHCLLVALVAQDIARAMFPPDSPQIESTVCAALTMNVAAMRMHAELTYQSQALDPKQRESIVQHPEDSVIALHDSGIVDEDWLIAVSQHHENLDGTGYPQHLHGDEVRMPARIIRLADFYVAKIRGRRYRLAQSTRSAFKHIFGDERGRLDSHIALLLLRRLGLYPPGTLLRLASREIAVVVRKQGNGQSAGNVMAFLGPTGRALKQPAERNTGQIDYSVLNVTEIEPGWPEIDWPALWGY